jgi:hypothetical protein
VRKKSKTARTKQPDPIETSVNFSIPFGALAAKKKKKNAATADNTAWPRDFLLVTCMTNAIIHFPSDFSIAFDGGLTHETI